MGITIYAKGFKGDLTGGGSMLSIIRNIVAVRWDKEFGEHYKTLFKCSDKKDYDAFNEKANAILKDDRFKQEDTDIVEFLFLPDSGAKVNYKTCGKLSKILEGYNEKIRLQYVQFSSGDDMAIFKEMLKHCYSKRASLTWY